MKTFAQIGTDIGALVEQKNAAYGSSFAKAGDFLRLLFPSGIAPERYDDALLLVRIFDKQMRVATDSDAFGESPYADITGYGILGTHLHQQRKDGATCPGSASDQNASSSSKAQPGSAPQPTSAKTITSASALSEPRPSRPREDLYEQPKAATALIAGDGVSDDVDARRNKLIHSAHAYDLWLQRHNNLLCIGCSASVMGEPKLEIPVRASLGVIRLFTCSQECWDFCYLRISEGKVQGAKL